MASLSAEKLVPTSLVVGLQIANKRVAVFGTGSVANTRALFALDAGAFVRLITPEIDSERLHSSLRELVKSGKVEHVEATKLSASLIADIAVVFVTDLGEEIAVYDLLKASHSLGIPVNIANRRDLSDFTLMSTYSGATGLQIAVSTNGVADRVATSLLKEIVRKLPDGLEAQLGDIARFNEVAKKAEAARLDAVRSLDARFSDAGAQLKTLSAKDIPASPRSDNGCGDASDLSAAATIAQTPALCCSSAASISDPSETAAAADFRRESHLDFSALAFTSTAAEQREEVSLEIDAQTASGYIAYALSDICYVYSSPEQDIGSSVLSWSETKEPNLAGAWTTALRMQSRPGAGNALLGSLANGATPSVLASGAAVPYLLATIQSLVRDRVGVVFHITARTFDGEGCARSDLSEVLVGRQTGAVFLSSSTAQEAHDISLVAHAIARALRVPVIHIVNGDSSVSAKVAVRMATFSKLPEILESVAPPAELPALGEASRFVAETLVRFGQTTGRNYQTFEFLGHSDADTVVVALGNAHLKAASVVRSLESEPSARIGLLNLRLYSPWDINSFVSSLPASVVHLIVLGEMDQELAPRTDPLYADVAVGALIGRPASGIKIAYENVYAVDGFDLMNLIRGHAGLDPLGEREEEKEKESTKAETTPTLATPAHVEDDKDSFESTVEIAKRFVFSEAYETATAAVSSKEKKYEITVRELRRLTPDHYDRNVFHIDFDTSGSGFSYEIGDALGVYGQNDAKAVDEFLDFYGVDGDAYVTSSVDRQTQTRSVRQWLVSSLDIFGRPSKKFYSKLAEYARDPTEAEKLQWLTTSEGAAEFKARVDDTVTYADLLREFRSARPSIRQLIEAIPAIKPRHYSIASSSRMHPDSVQLLVVAVEWKTSNGTVRTGQCTRYLNSLQAGDKVTVSVKPSVMKLPEDDERPIIMAGLGTGMAPFRAFIEERAVRRSEGKKVGPIVLYFGSRHRSMEYLYGEELEAYAADGLLTNLRLAFSRDQKHKIYIQHRMREDAELLSEYMLKRGGHFYLCGPTWPAGDVKDAMVHSFTEYGEVKPGDASRVIEVMKEEERYILEVY